MAKIDIKNGSAAATPASGIVSIYTKTDKKLYIKDDTGLETDLTGAIGITSLTGDVTGSGAGAVATTLATVNSNVGSFTNASLTVNAKGLVTAVSSGGPSYTDEEAQDAVGTILTDSANIDFTYNDGVPSITADLTDTAVTAGAYTTANITVDAKGRITAASSGVAAQDDLVTFTQFGGL